LFTVDRALNRWRDYPQFVARLNGQFDVYHVVDHSYSHLLHKLPSRRAIVTCHDLEAFRCLLEPDQEPRSQLFKKALQYVLTGLQQATHIACVSGATRDALIAYGLVAPERVSVVPNGADPACSSQPNQEADRTADILLGPRTHSAIEILHVGSTIPRKRIDVLLRVIDALRMEAPAVRLVRIGEPPTASQRRLIDRLDLRSAVTVLPFLDKAVLAAVYRRAALVLLPSEREGFGLPVVEAMACGTPVVASDIPALREVGGRATAYCPVGDVERWTETVLELLRERREEPDRWASRREACIRQAATFTWQEHTRRMVELYQQVLNS
jgi:glycosyltransferase involved in cell wall biosynthesis